MSQWKLPPTVSINNNLYGHTKWTNSRYFTPIHEMPHEWQPRLNRVNPYHWTGMEILKDGWTKWNSAGHPHIIAESATATEPDWYTRRIRDIREEDKQCEQWAYDRWGKPTSLSTLGLGHIAAQEPYRRYPHRGIDRTTVKPGILEHGEKPIHYGTTSGFDYEVPIRARTFPPIADPKHV
ncbi:hypothetical protein CSKR_101862 [Clonorchis sinensis]|uniref:Uncharacterized protein n=2 Tax=Clonorchis sinensis TaxID=79923 RepID=A0A8T1M6E6_CLOSI|nr:hypothetical protein CSKR_101862 [Clonorchis sinensis]